MAYYPQGAHSVRVEKAKLQIIRHACTRDSYAFPTLHCRRRHARWRAKR